ncbi:MAG TPA: toll/interleukin-1 receptor domain-containing protein [Mucilaginibacter sp.]|jgi:hypothetical protein
MEKSKWITAFEDLDINKELKLNIRIFRGNLNQSFVQDNDNILLQRMYKLKRKIGYLSDNAKLNYLKQQNIPQPIMPNFGGNDVSDDIMAQAFYQCDINWYEFINVYTGYLIKKTEVSDSKSEEGRKVETYTKKKFVVNKPKVFFSYAWNEASEDIVTKLYDSLKKDGHTVIRDKNDLGYKGLISEFIQDIGNGEFVIIAISDKYLRSDYCMSELYELFRNSKLETKGLLKKIYPIRVESMTLNDPVLLKDYFDYWKKREEQFKDLVYLHDYDQEQYRRIKNIYNYLGQLLPFLNDINVSTKELLSENNFAVIKMAIKDRMKIASPNDNKKEVATSDADKAVKLFKKQKAKIDQFPNNDDEFWRNDTLTLVEKFIGKDTDQYSLLQNHTFWPNPFAINKETEESQRNRGKKMIDSCINYIRVHGIKKN